MNDYKKQIIRAALETIKRYSIALYEIEEDRSIYIAMNDTSFGSFGCIYCMTFGILGDSENDIDCTNCPLANDMTTDAKKNWINHTPCTYHKTYDELSCAIKSNKAHVVINALKDRIEFHKDIIKKYSLKTEK